MFVLYDENMNIIPFPDGAKPLDIFISSISKDRTEERLEGANSLIDYGSTFNTRSVELYMLLVSADTKDYRLLRNSIFAMFQTTDILYVSEAYEPGKRYKIAIDESFIPERVRGNQQYADAKISCHIIGTPFAESIGKTQSIQQNGIDADSELWGFGMGLIADDESLIYTHTGTSFKIFNAGNEKIHPYEQELKITIDNITGISNSIELKNVTTGDVFNAELPIGSESTIVLDGPNVTRNGLQFYRNTNRQFITLAPGWNEFIVSGVDSARVSFDFRFYYK